MRKIISIIVIIMISIQSIILGLFFTDKLSSYPINLVDIAWIGSSLLTTLFGVLFFKVNKELKMPTSTITSIALLGIIGFQFMIFNYWGVVLLLIVLAFGLHIYRYRDSKFTIFPVIATIMGIYSIGLLMFAKWIASM